MPGPRAKAKYAQVARQEQNWRDRCIDDLVALEEIQTTILPAIRKELKAGANEEELMEKYRAVIMAQLMSTALTDKNPNTRLAAAKDFLDRAMGKPTQKLEQTHKLEKLPKEQILALLQSEIQTLSGSSDDEEETTDDLPC